MERPAGSKTLTAPDWDKSFVILTRAVFLGIKYSIEPMRKVGGGSIISTSSVAGLRGVAGLHAYSAAKAAVVSLTESAAIELGHDRIRVNCICPGGVVTPLVYRGMRGGEEAARDKHGEVATDSTRRTPRGYRRDGAVSRQRRRRMDHRHCDGSRWRHEYRQRPDKVRHGFFGTIFRTSRSDQRLIEPAVAPPRAAIARGKPKRFA